MAGVYAISENGGNTRGSHSHDNDEAVFRNHWWSIHHRARIATAEITKGNTHPTVSIDI
jgi:hypothetical protein